MTRSFLVVTVVALLAGSGCAGFAPIEVDIPMMPSAKLSDEEVIAAVLDDVHRGMQDRHVYRVLAHVSRNYRDAEGRDYAAIQDYLKEVFSLYRELRIMRVPPRIEVRGYQATVVETFGTNAEPFNAADSPPLQLQGQVTVRLEKVDNRWLIVEWGNVQ